MSKNQQKAYDKLLKAYSKYLAEFVDYYEQFPPAQTAGQEGPGTLPPPPP